MQRWVERGRHLVRELPTDPKAINLTAVAWCKTVPDAQFISCVVKETKPQISGSAVCRVRAANGVDSLEKLISIHAAPAGHDMLDPRQWIPQIWFTMRLCPKPSSMVWRVLSPRK